MTNTAAVAPIQMTVPSHTTKGTEYTITIKASCSCPAYLYSAEVEAEKHCKHADAIQALLPELLGE